MIVVHLIARGDEYDSEPGLQLADMRQFDGAASDRGGLNTAHDVLEHMNGADKIGDIADELEALGAIWYVRGQHHMIRRGLSFYGPHVEIAADVSYMAQGYYEGADTNDLVPRTCKCAADYHLDEILRHAESMTRGELLDSGEPLDGERLAHYFRIARARMRIGYRKAARKYQDRDVLGLFWNIADVVEKAIKQNELIEGMKFTLRYDFNGRVTCEPVYNEEY